VADTSSYKERLKADLGALIDAVDLDDMQRRFVRSRWLDQVLWMESRADHARRRYYGLRLTAALGGVTVPTLVGLGTDGTAGDVLRGLTIGLGLLVAMSVAVEELIRYGERFRHYRRTVELLKSEGWQFFQLSGPYRRYGTHRLGYPSFAARVEGIIQPSVEVYVSELVAEHKEGKEPNGHKDEEK
jgi:hypothetical protein